MLLLFNIKSLDITSNVDPEDITEPVILTSLDVVINPLPSYQSYHYLQLMK
jgi:hypothetical protein